MSRLLVNSAFWPDQSVDIFSFKFFLNCQCCSAADASAAVVSQLNVSAVLTTNCPCAHQMRCTKRRITCNKWSSTPRPTRRNSTVELRRVGRCELAIIGRSHRAHTQAQIRCAFVPQCERPFIIYLQHSTSPQLS